jgi:hypothetical protein
MLLQLDFGVARQVVDHVAEHVDISRQFREIAVVGQLDPGIEINAAHQVGPVAQAQ